MGIVSDQAVLFGLLIAVFGLLVWSKIRYDRVRKLDVRAGDVLLLLGPTERLDDVVNWLGCLPLQQHDLQVIQRNKAWIAAASFVLAIAATTAGIVHLP
jgi:hypothetical protein